MRINEGWAEEQAIREAIMRYIFPVPEEEPELAHKLVDQYWEG